VTKTQTHMELSWKNTKVVIKPNQIEETNFQSNIDEIKKFYYY